MRKSITFFVAATVLLCGCIKNGPETEITDEPGNVPDAPVKIPITLSTDIWTKATDNGYENGDKVGIYTVNQVNGESGDLANSGNHLDNTRFTYDSGKWNPDSPVYWLDQTTAADFYCYYPYTQSISDVTAIPFDVKTDQSSIENYKASELLWGKTLGAEPSEDPVKISL